MPVPQGFAGVITAEPAALQRPERRRSRASWLLAAKVYCNRAGLERRLAGEAEQHDAALALRKPAPLDALAQAPRQRSASNRCAR